MIFTRTKSGMGNYKHFYDAEIMVYIEGRESLISPGSPIPYDQAYYDALLKKILVGRKFKVKCVGSKNNVIEYSTKLRTNCIADSFAIVDRDYDGIYSSIIENKYLIYSYKYSWENEIFNIRTAHGVLNDLNPLGLPVSDLNYLGTRVRSLIKRLGFISMIDAVLQNIDTPLLSNSKGSCGIGFSANKNCQILKVEIRRLIEKSNIKAKLGCQFVKDLITRLLEFPKDFLIQGHLWCFAIIRLVSEIFKVSNKETTISNKVVFNLFFSKYLSNVKKYLSPDCFSHYERHVNRVLEK